MSNEPGFLSASKFELAELAELYTATFANYFYPCVVTPEDMASYIRVEQLDLDLSPVMCLGNDLVGLATVGMRDAQAYCKGFGVVVPFRGQGLSHALCDEMVRRVERAGACQLTLGVLKDNERAVNAYRRVGFQVLRDLVSLEWVRGKGTEASEPAPPPNAVKVAGPKELLEHFGAFHAVRPIWNRDLPSLRELDDLEGLMIGAESPPEAYVLFQSARDGSAEILDLGAKASRGPASGTSSVALLQALQQRHERVFCSNEAGDNPLLASFQEAGFVETLRRYELALDL